ncbi:SPOR domain-containing protein [Candidatus Poribacteria bacterium]|nr:SPOR domain-containing protein [Candidatus Poribacteria bacterium]
MVVPGKNLGENMDNKDKNKKILIYSGIGVGVIALVVGVFFLFKFVILTPEHDEETKENEIEKILDSVKNESHQDTPVYGGMTAKEKALKKSFNKSNDESLIDKEVIAKNKEKAATELPSYAPVKSEKKEEPQKVITPSQSEKKPEMVVKSIERPQEKIITKIDTSTIKYTIQVAAFKNSKNAMDDLNNLQSRGFKPELKTVDLGAKGTWYRLRVGKHKTEEPAKQELWQLKSIGYKNAEIKPY